jgi:hypothetical protein
MILFVLASREVPSQCRWRLKGSAAAVALESGFAGERGAAEFHKDLVFSGQSEAQQLSQSFRALVLSLLEEKGLRG